MIEVTTEGGINLTLEVGQGPAGPSTVAAQSAQALAEQARDTALAARDVAVPASESAAISASVALQAYTSSFANFGTYAAALEAIQDVNTYDGQIILIFADERKQGFSTFSVVNPAVQSGLSLDFSTEMYSITERIEFVNFFGLHQVLPPVSSTDPAIQGSFAFDSNFLYLAHATNSWKRIALGAF